MSDHESDGSGHDVLLENEPDRKATELRSRMRREMQAKMSGEIARRKIEQEQKSGESSNTTPDRSRSPGDRGRSEIHDTGTAQLNAIQDAADAHDDQVTPASASTAAKASRLRKARMMAGKAIGFGHRTPTFAPKPSVYTPPSPLEDTGSPTPSPSGNQGLTPPVSSLGEDALSNISTASSSPGKVSRLKGLMTKTSMKPRNTNRANSTPPSPKPDADLPVLASSQPTAYPADGNGYPPEDSLPSPLTRKRTALFVADHNDNAGPGSLDVHDITTHHKRGILGRAANVGRKIMGRSASPKGGKTGLDTVPDATPTSSRAASPASEDGSRLGCSALDTRAPTADAAANAEPPTSTAPRALAALAPGPLEAGGVTNAAPVSRSSLRGRPARMSVLADSAPEKPAIGETSVEAAGIGYANVPCSSSPRLNKGDPVFSDIGLEQSSSTFPSSSIGGRLEAPMVVTDCTEETASLRRLLRAAEQELERRDQELRAFRPLGVSESSASCAAALREEQRRLVAEMRLLSERHRQGLERKRSLEANLHEREQRAVELERRLLKASKSPPGSPSLCGSGGIAGGSSDTGQGWRQRAASLEDVLKVKSETVVRLQQREFWFEQQLQRQAEVNNTPWELLLSEVEALRTGISRLADRSAPGLKRSSSWRVCEEERRQPLGLTAANRTEASRGGRWSGGFGVDHVSTALEGSHCTAIDLQNDALTSHHVTRLPLDMSRLAPSEEADNYPYSRHGGATASNAVSSAASNSSMRCREAPSLCRSVRSVTAGSNDCDDSWSLAAGSTTPSLTSRSYSAPKVHSSVADAEGAGAPLLGRWANAAVPAPAAAAPLSRGRRSPPCGAGVHVV